MKFQLKSKICDQVIDSAAKPFGQKFVYLSSGDILFKMEINSEERAVVRWAKKLSKWSEEIKPPVTMMYTAKANPQHINLINVCLN